MNRTGPRWLLALGVSMALGACTAPPVSAGNGQVYAGWYMGNGTFQPCGSKEQWRIADQSAINTKAHAAGLEANDPVYVRVTGERNAADLRVISVDQVGSPRPVSDCPLTGVVTRSPSGG